MRPKIYAKDVRLRRKDLQLFLIHGVGIPGEYPHLDLRRQ